MIKIEHKPVLSVVVVVYNMPREAPRTLHSLSASYQRHINADDYEVIVVDNGSNPPFDPKVIQNLSGNFRLIRIDPAPPSPAQAINRGLAEARGDVIGVMIDGARLVTPGLLHFARHAAYLYDRAVVSTVGWYLGYDLQNWAMKAGYDQISEDALLETIGWPQDGYRLFEIATMDESSVDGWLTPISESNGLFLLRELWDELGGFDERFDLAGGGLLNLDTFRRAVELPNSELVLLLGEATFHQLHGGTSTNASPEMARENWSRWARQYEAIRGHPYQLPTGRAATYLGVLPRSALARFARAIIDPVWTGRSAEPPLGLHFDRELWSLVPVEQPADPIIAALVDLAQNEFRGHRFESAAAVSRLVRERAPEEREPQRLLSLIGSWLSLDGPPEDRKAEYHCALAEAHRLLGEHEAAAVNYRIALTFNENLPQAHLGLAGLPTPVGGETARAVSQFKIVTQQPDLTRTVLTRALSSSTSRLIVFLTPGYELRLGGVLSIARTFEESAALQHLHGARVILCTIPGDPHLLRYTWFENSNYILNFESVLERCRHLDYLLLHIPEYAVNQVLDWLSSAPSALMRNVRDVHFNVLLQNIDLIKGQNIASLKQFGRVTCTTGHEAYTNSATREMLGVTLHRLSVCVGPELYSRSGYQDKEPLLIASHDDHPLKEQVLRKIAQVCPELRIQVIHDLSYEDYKKLIRRAKWSLTFGEGLDGYFAEPVWSGGVSFAVFNDRFFTAAFAQLENVYPSWEVLQDRITADLRRLDELVAYNQCWQPAYDLLSDLYSPERFRENLSRFYRGEYTFP